MARIWVLATSLLCISLVVAADPFAGRIPGFSVEDGIAGSATDGLSGMESPGLKKEWPELVGVAREVARQAIISSRPDVTVYFVPPGMVVTMDYRPYRVRVFIQNDIVVSPPRVG